MTDQLRCSQCGATAFDELEGQRMRCQYCQTLYQRRPPPEAAPRGAKLVIGKNAKVVFGARGHVIVHGGVQIEDGADVQVLGHLEIVEPADPDAAQAAKERLARGG